MSQVKIVLGDSIIYVKPSQVSAIQAKIKARQLRDENISKELQAWRLLPSQRTNQFSSWIGQKVLTFPKRMITENEMVYSV
jgi:hypothetical protein